jgi:hypothetical protein
MEHPTLMATTVATCLFYPIGYSAHTPYAQTPLANHRQGEPVRAIHNTASTNRRVSFAVTPQSPALPDRKSWITSHLVSLNTVLAIVLCVQNKK